MSDRFKFRVWSKDENKYLDNFYLGHTCEKGCTSFDGVVFDDEQVEHNCIIEQCTGLRDKNGKLIYEGDILRAKNCKYWVVIWDGNNLCFKVSCKRFGNESHKENYLYSTYKRHLDNAKIKPSDWLEIIGNIHENPDALL